MAEFDRYLSVGPKAPFPGQDKITSKWCKQGRARPGDSPAGDIPDTTHVAKVIPHSCGRRAWVRFPSMSSLLWQTQKWRNAGRSFSRNLILLSKAKSLKSPSWVTPIRELGHCLQRNVRGFWGRWSQISASASPLLPWTDCPNNFSQPLALRSILSCGKSPVLSSQTSKNALRTPNPEATQNTLLLTGCNTSAHTQLINPMHQWVCHLQKET